MRITTSKSKNSESFYITQSYTNANGKSTSKTIRKLGTLAELSAQLHTDRDGVVEWANEQARLETLKYKSEKEDATVKIPFHSNRLMDYNKQKLFSGGYLFLQSIFLSYVFLFLYFSAPLGSPAQHPCSYINRSCSKLFIYLNDASPSRFFYLIQDVSL